MKGINDGTLKRCCEAHMADREEFINELRRSYSPSP